VAEQQLVRILCLADMSGLASAGSEGVWGVSQSRGGAAPLARWSSRCSAARPACPSIVAWVLGGWAICRFWRPERIHAREVKRLRRRWSVRYRSSIKRPHLRGIKCGSGRLVRAETSHGREALGQIVRPRWLDVISWPRPCE
jgi:hypothetical protein